METESRPPVVLVLSDVAFVLRSRPSCVASFPGFGLGTSGGCGRVDLDVLAGIGFSFGTLGAWAGPGLSVIDGL